MDQLKAKIDATNSSLKHGNGNINQLGDTLERDYAAALKDGSKPDYASGL